MKQLISTKINTQDVVAGFFGWVLISNLVFLLISFLIHWNGVNEVLFSKIFWLFTIIAILVLSAIKKFGLGAGVAAAFLINSTLWTAILFLIGMRTLGNLFYNVPVFSGFPLPLGLYILLLGFT